METKERKLSSATSYMPPELTVYKIRITEVLLNGSNYTETDPGINDPDPNNE